MTVPATRSLTTEVVERDIAAGLSYSSGTYR